MKSDEKQVPKDFSDLVISSAIATNSEVVEILNELIGSGVDLVTSLDIINKIADKNLEGEEDIDIYLSILNHKAARAIIETIVTYLEFHHS